MPVYFNSNKIIPAPFVAITKDYNTTDDVQQIGSSFNITVKGKLIAYKGSPNSSGVFWNVSGYPPDEVIADDSIMGSLIRKQEALRSLFANEGRSFEVQPWDGSAPIKCNPRVKRIDFLEGSPTSWYNHMEYIITLEADILYVNGLAQGEDSGDIINYKVSKANEEWNIESADENNRTYRLTHAVSAQGKRFYDSTGALVKPAWQNAQDYVLSRLQLGLQVDKMVASGVLNANTLQAYNYVRGQHQNTLGGGFSVNETWLCFDASGNAPAVEDFTVSAKTSEDGKTRVSVEGQIKGLEVRNNTTFALISTKYANALNLWQNVVSNNVLAQIGRAHV